MTKARAIVSAPERDSSQELLVQLARKRARWLAFLSRRCDSATAEDVVQTALGRAAAKIQTLRDPTQVDAWFFRVLRRTLAEHYAARARDEKRRQALMDQVDVEAPEEVAGCGCVLGLLDRIPESQRAVVEGVDLSDETIREAAERLGITENNASVRLHRARNGLRRALEEHCATTSVAGCADCAC